jgi:hypothetical protein
MRLVLPAAARAWRPASQAASAIASRLPQLAARPPLRRLVPAGGREIRSDAAGFSQLRQPCKRRGKRFDGLDRCSFMPDRCNYRAPITPSKIPSPSPNQPPSETAQMPQPPTTTTIETLPAATTIADTAITASLRQHAEAARGAYAGNTERALRADVAIFTRWCATDGRQALPASPETVAAFIDAMATNKAPATVRRYVSRVATFHRAAGVANPCEAQAVKLALKRMHRERGLAQAQAAPLNDVLVARMLAAAGSTLRDLRNKALLAVA